jgi:hypothetical protein
LVGDAGSVSSHTSLAAVKERRVGGILGIAVPVPVLAMG